MHAPTAKTQIISFLFFIFTFFFVCQIYLFIWSSLPDSFYLVTKIFFVKNMSWQEYVLVHPTQQVIFFCQQRLVNYYIDYDNIYFSFNINIINIWCMGFSSTLIFY